MNGQACYLIAVNIAGFALCAIGARRKKNGRIRPGIAVFALLGGTPGILAAILAFDRRAVKENMLERVFLAACSYSKLSCF